MQIQPGIRIFEVRNEYPYSFLSDCMEKKAKLNNHFYFIKSNYMHIIYGTGSINIIWANKGFKSLDFRLFSEL